MEIRNWSKVNTKPHIIFNWEKFNQMEREIASRCHWYLNLDEKKSYIRSQINGVEK
jgi:hypothetical protein